jgi:hypothetical protein
VRVYLSPFPSLDVAGGIFICITSLPHLVMQIFKRLTSSEGLICICRSYRHRGYTTLCKMSKASLIPAVVATGPFELIETPIHAKNMTVSLFYSFNSIEQFKPVSSEIFQKSGVIKGSQKSFNEKEMSRP